MEQWKKIDGFERYSVSDKGQVRNDERATMVKPMTSTSGYSYVHLVRNRKKHTQYIHRLVGQAFLSNHDELPQIDHIDGCKTNNNLDNLRWVTVSQNYLAYGREARAENRKRAVKAVHIDGREVVFHSRMEAAEFFQCSDTKIKYNYLYKKGSKKGWTLYLID